MGVASRRSNGRSRPASSGWAVAGIAAALTAALAAPILIAPASRIFGTELAGRHHDPFTVIQQFDTPVEGGIQQPVTDRLGQLLAGLIGPVPAYNLLVLSSFPLAAALAFLFALRLSGSRLAAAFAGLTFAFAPFHVAHAAYHPHVAQVHWLALFFLASWLWAERPDASRGVLLALAATLVGGSNLYAGFMVAVLAPITLLLFWRAAKPAAVEGAATGRRWRVPASAVAAVVGLAALSPVVAALWPVLGFPRSDVWTFSARPWSYLMPPAEHAVFGGAARALWARAGQQAGLVEQQVGVGWGLIGLAICGSWFCWRGRVGAGPRRSVAALGGIGAAAFVCSLGPELRVGGWAIPSPSGLLHDAFPMFRSFARFGGVVQLMLAIAGGVGFAALFQAGDRRRMAALALAGLVALEYAPIPWRWRDVLPTEAHRWVADLPPPVRVLDCGPDRETTTLPALWPAGHVATGPTPVVADCGEPALGTKLAALGFTHVIIPPGDPAGRLIASAGGERTGLALKGKFPRAWVYAVAAAAAPGVYVERLAGFGEREYRENRSWRWMGDHGTLTLANPSGSAAAVLLEVELVPFGMARRLRLELDGRPLAPLDVAPGRRRYDLGPLPVAPGSSTLRLLSEPPATVADTLERNGDLRPLSVALGAWTVRPLDEGRFARREP